MRKLIILGVILTMHQLPSGWAFVRTVPGIETLTLSETGQCLRTVGYDVRDCTLQEFSAMVWLLSKQN